MTNRYPLWKYLMLIVLVIFGIIYSLPNLYSDIPAIQISAAEHGVQVTQETQAKASAALEKNQIAFDVVSKADASNLNSKSLFFTFKNIDIQAKAQEVVKTALGDNYITALYLMPSAPKWLNNIGAKAMRLGLDLRGGVHFLLAVDVDAVFKRLASADLRSVAQELRSDKIRYAGLSPFRTDDAQGILIKFRNNTEMDKAYKLVTKKYTDYQWSRKDEAGKLVLEGSMGEQQFQTIRQNTMDQSMTILRNRVNELGISEAVVTQQGMDQIAVDLPGIQDVAQAQNIIGKTATLEFHLVDSSQSAEQAAMTGVVPADTTLEYNDEKRPFLLEKDIVLQGSSVTNATANYGEQGPEVNIKLSGGAAVTKFNQITAQNVGRLLSVLYVESRPVTHKENGKMVTSYKTEKRVISAARINSALGNSFRITGLSGIEEASTLALLLRAGALPVPIHIAQERTIGPSLGQQNIDKGLASIEIGFILVVIIMALYYRLFGIVANVALAMNLVLIVSIMSILGAVLTLPGIAGMVLTVGMAVDANVLIFERIREELRLGITPQAAIYTGYDRAMTTIIDSNVTTLIVAIVLFSLGSGPVKGFAVTLTIGLMTSMITSIVGTRAIINLIYGNRKIKQLSIGIKHKVKQSVFDRGAANS